VHSCPKWRCICAILKSTYPANGSSRVHQFFDEGIFFIIGQIGVGQAPKTPLYYEVPTIRRGQMGHISALNGVDCVVCVATPSSLK
jgi:hypothetical protein